jgi:hypothetical protein
VEKDLKVIFGKMLGEIYRIQNRMNPKICPVQDSAIYGLLNGIEPVIDEEIEGIGFISKEQYEFATKVLSNIENDPERKKDFKGFYDIEKELSDGGISRGMAIQIFKHIKAFGGFADLFAKMNSVDSPTECKKFELYEWDK